MSDDQVTQQAGKGGKKVAAALGLSVLFAALAALLVIGGIAYLFMSQPFGGVCQSKQCFIDAANDCGSATLTSQESYGTASYFAYDCIITKNITALSPGEPESARRLLEGKGFYCVYEKGAFDRRWVDSLTLGLENCHGELRDAIGVLLFSTYVAEENAGF
jgi:hypothetical protein